MIKRRHLGVVIGILLTGAADAGPAPLADESRILPSSLDLERRVEPWCPGDCSVSVPFIASYKRGRERLVFVGAHHAFQPTSPTMRAVTAAFAMFQPKIVIVEGFPTAMGEDPEPLVAQARRYGTPNADEFAKTEAMYAASTALKRRIPFVGGEPTREEEIGVLKTKGFTAEDIAFNAMAGYYSQALRSGDMSDMSLESLLRQYGRVAYVVKLPLHQGGWNMDPLSFEQFRQRYMEMYGTELAGDTQFPHRIDVVFDRSRNGDQTRADMVTRDRHLLGLIEQQLTDRRSVLVVYGGSHWATLSSALEKRLGKPTVRPFLK